jgi:hypothetical protein
MSIRLFKNRIFKLILIFFLLSSTMLNAFSLTIGGATRGITKYMQGQVNNYTHYLSNQVSSLISQYLGDIGINIQCLVPNLNFEKYFNISTKGINLCTDLRKFYQFKIGPCSVSANIVNNPIFKVLNSLCTGFLNGHYQIEFVFNGSLATIVEEEGLSISDNQNIPIESKIVYPSGLTFKDIYGTFDGKQLGYFASVAKVNPSLPDARAWLTDDKKALIVKENLLKTSKSKTTDLNKALLPLNNAQAYKLSRDNAKIYAQAEPNIVDLISETQKVLGKYVAEHQNHFDEEDFLRYFTDFVNGKLTDDFGNRIDVIVKAYKSLDDAINFKYANKLLILKATSKFYVYSPTLTKLQSLPIKKRKEFLYKALIWNAQKTDLLGQREEERTKKHNKIRIALRKAYIASVPFNKDKANAELQMILTGQNKGGGIGGLKLPSLPKLPQLPF